MRENIISRRVKIARYPIFSYGLFEGRHVCRSTVLHINQTCLKVPDPEPRIRTFD
jgi:hypothetical protein